MTKVSKRPTEKFSDRTYADIEAFQRTAANQSGQTFASRYHKGSFVLAIFERGRNVGFA